MAKTATLDPQTLAILNNAARGEKPVSDNPSETPDLMAELLRSMIANQKLQQEELAEQKEAKLRKQAEQEAMRQSNIQAVKERQERILRNQAACAHIKQDGKPAIGGQFDHRRRQIFICVKCQKTFIGNELPVHLRNLPYAFGGPSQ